tara:strand:- start:572 stop:2050 length:1479 start_codon:yes stop_codon:yes gene_type:complete
MSNGEPEVININSLGDETVIMLDASDKETLDGMDKPSVNFGDGIELLMNDKRKQSGTKTPTSDIDINDLAELEADLNDLSSDISSHKSPSKSGLFNEALNSSGGIKINIDDTNPISISKSDIDKNNDLNDRKPKPIISDASKINPNNKTWDGFQKFNNIPLDPDKNINTQSKLSPEETLREKLKVLRKLEDLEKKGVKLSKKYNMESPLAEMQGEYEMIIAEKEKSASCKFQGRMLMAAITGLEFLNNRFDPFDVKLDGWAEQLNENLDDYDEIFGELHEKYKSKAKMAPELKLLFQLGGSAIMVHMTNTMFKSAMPGMDDIMRQNPELMQQFTQAAVNTMGESSPGFGGFMNNFMPGNDRTPPQPNTSRGPPPAPMKTQTSKSQRSAVPNNRPDIAFARDDGISIQEQFESVGQQPGVKTNKSQRPEMKGPTDINDLLSGIKTKNITVAQPNKDNNSTISVQELKELSNAKQVPRSKRRQKSDKNVVSLEL